MAVLQSSANNVSTMVVDATASAGHVTLRTNESLGSYRASLVSGTIAASTAAANVLFTFKNTGTNQCIVRSVQTGFQATTAFTQGSVRLSLYPIRGNFHTQALTNGTQTIFSATNKKRTSQANPTATAVICTTTGIIGDQNPPSTTVSASTGEDTAPMGTILLNLPNAITTAPPDGLRDLLGPYTGSFPFVLAPNEGFRIKNDTAFPATGSGNLVVSVEWDEATSY